MGENDMINIGILGLGTVGTGVVEIVNSRKDELKTLLGRQVNIKKILVKNKDKKRDTQLEDGILTDNFDEILNDKDIEIIIEVTSVVDESYHYIKQALNNNKHVVTANKAVVSKYFEELSELAYKNGRAFLYEASVGGGIPVLKPLKDQLVLNEIEEVQGILNGTCNYILTRMVDEGIDYKDVLEIAQELGYAEADPSADVEGHDTLRKLRILGSLGLKGKVSEEDIELRGINRIKSTDIDNIKAMDSRVKLIGEVKAVEGGFTASVQPMIMKNSHYFSSVNMAYNSVAFKGENVGELKFYGPGAGKLPTANAILTDVIDIIKGTYFKTNPLGNKQLKNMNEDMKVEYYIRIPQRQGILQDLKFATKEVISSNKDIAIITKEINLKDIFKLLEEKRIKEEECFIAKVLY